MLRGLGLAPSELVASAWVDNGPGWCALLLRSRAAVLDLTPDYAALEGLRVGVVAPWNPAVDGEEAQFEVRAFTAGGFEDPVTSSLNAGVAEWLIGSCVVATSYVAAQGTALGRAGRVHVEADASGIWVGGATATVGSGTVVI